MSSRLLLLTPVSPSPSSALSSSPALLTRCLTANDAAADGTLFVHVLPLKREMAERLPDEDEVEAAPVSAAVSAAKRVHAAAAGRDGLDLRLLLTRPFKKRINAASIRALKSSELGAVRGKAANKNKLIDDAGAKDDTAVDNVVLGGTFDRLHAGHKILLSEAGIRCRKRMVIGVTELEMLRMKDLAEKIQPCKARKKYLKQYLQSCDPSLNYKIVGIRDPFGPSVVERDLQLILGSKETEMGCQAVNKKREENGLPKLKIILVGLLEDPRLQGGKKVSSSVIRQNLGNNDDRSRCQRCRDRLWDWARCYCLYSKCCDQLCRDVVDSHNKF